jgi:hypothetical protein
MPLSDIKSRFFLNPRLLVWRFPFPTTSLSDPDSLSPVPAI